MPIFLVATGPALALLAQLTGWHADRKQVSLIPQIESNLLPWTSAAPSHNRGDIETLRARNRGDISKLRGPHNRPGQPPIV